LEEMQISGGECRRAPGQVTKQKECRGCWLNTPDAKSKDCLEFEQAGSTAVKFRWSGTLNLVRTGCTRSHGKIQSWTTV
jgi:hypothetical protein